MTHPDLRGRSPMRGARMAVFAIACALVAACLQTPNALPENSPARSAARSTPEPSAQPSSPRLATSSPTPTATRKPEPVNGRYGVVVTGLFGPALQSQTYTVALVGADGRTAASATAARVRIGPEISTVSASSSRLYFLDGPSRLRYLTPDGVSATVRDLSVGSGERVAFAVSPDDLRIAVAVIDVVAPSNSVRLYIEDLGGGGHRDLLTSRSRVFWPVGWRGPQLVIGTREDRCPVCDTFYFPSGYVVVDPNTGAGVVELCTGGTQQDLTRNATAAGVLCVKNRGPQDGFRVDTVVVGWDGSERVVPMHCWAQGGALSPNGELVADMEYRPCREGHLRIIDRAGRSAAPTGLPDEGRPGGWVDDQNLVYRATNDRLMVVNVVTAKVSPLEAEGTFVANLPPNF